MMPLKFSHEAFLLLSLTAIYLHADVNSDTDSVKPPEISQIAAASSLKKTQKTPLTKKATSTKKQTVYISGEFLYWKGESDAMPYVSSSKPLIDPGFFAGYENQELHRVKFGFDPGFRVGIGYHLPYDAWDLLVSGTYFRTDGRASISRSPDRVLQSVWDQISVLYTDKASAKQKLFLGLVDFEIGRNIKFSDAFSLRPLVGVRGAFIDQNLDIVYTGIPNPTEASILVDLDNDFHAVGLRAGFDLQWKTKVGLGLYGKSAISALAGKFHISESQKVNDGDVTVLNPSQFLSFSSIKAALEVGAGINWQTLFNKDHFRFMINLGYEFSYWPNQNHLYTVGPASQNGIQFSTTEGIQHSSDSGDVGFQGAVLGARFDF